MNDPTNINLPIQTEDNILSAPTDWSILACPKCSQKLRIPAEHRKMRLRCKACGEVFNHAGRPDDCDERREAKRTILSVIGGALGTGFAILLALFGAAVLTVFGVLAGAWIFAQIFNHGEMPSDEALRRIGFPIWIMFAFCIIPGGIKVLFRMLQPVAWLFGRILRPFSGKNGIPTEAAATTATSGRNLTSNPAALSATSGPQKRMASLPAFIFGMGLGLAAYAVYIRFLVADEPTALSVGWIFFVPQYLISWCGSLLSAPPIVVLVASWLSIMLFYGYLCSSVKLAPRLSIGTALVSSAIFLALVYWQNVDSVFNAFAKAAFWPAVLLREEFDYIAYSNHLVRILIECVTVACWHAGLIT